MSFPGFTAEKAVYKTVNTYRTGSYGAMETPGLIPSIVLRGCFASCCWQTPTGPVCDDGCIECCLCVRRGGHPQYCCQ